MVGSIFVFLRIRDKLYLKPPKVRPALFSTAAEGGVSMNFLIVWLIATLAVIITAYILPGVKLSGFFAALVTALILGLINAFIKPILILLTLPLNILTLGLFTFVINALLIMLTSAIVPGFHVDGFWWALLFSLLLSVVYYALSFII
jgi:putative membrane protein